MRRGVTFLELMIVLAILSVFLVFTFPMMKGTHRRNQLNAATRQFALLAKYARQEAILRGKTTELRVEIQKNSYRLVLDPEKESARNSGREDLREIEKTRELDAQRKRIRFSQIESATDPFGHEQIARIKFFSNGSASASTLVIEDLDKRQMTVEIAGASGAVRAYSGPPEPPPEIPATPE
jgi:prepilin-type N-terminal cleavage/methylation domain-containing protein